MTNYEIITIDTRFGQLKARSDTGVIYWADGDVWANWPTLKQEGLIRTEGRTTKQGYLADRGHLDLVLT